MSHFNRVICYQFAICIVVTGLLFLTSVNPVAAQSVTQSPKSPAILAIESKIDELESRRDRYDSEYIDLFKNVQANLGTTLAKVNKELESFGMAAVSIPTTLGLLSKQRVELSIDLAGLEARKIELNNLRNATNDESEDELAILKSLLKLEREAYDMTKVQVESGTVHSSQLHEAERRILMAQLRIAEATRGESQSGATRRELSSLSIEIAEKKARLSRVTNELERLFPAAKKLEEKEIIKIWLTSARQSLTRLDLERIEMSRELGRYKDQLERMRIEVLSEDN